MNNKFISIIVPVILSIFLIISISLYGYRQIKIKNTKFQKPQPQPTQSPTPNIRPFPSLIEQKSMQDLLSEAREDLAKRLSIEQSIITTREVASISWNDSSLGCPKPGMVYLQVLTPGYKILLEAKGEVYDYRTSLQHVKLCQ